MTTIDHQQAAVEAGACILMENDGWEDWPSNSDLGGNYATGTRDDEYRHEKEDLAKELLTAATPHLRAAWEQPIRELHRPVHAVFSWDDGPRYEEPCETCHGAPGVHECGCWADTQLEYVCAECHRLGSGSKGVYNYTYPCPTIQALDEKGTRS